MALLDAKQGDFVIRKDQPFQAVYVCGSVRNGILRLGYPTPCDIDIPGAGSMSLSIVDIYANEPGLVLLRQP